MRFFLEISYTGNNYHGWQVQPNAHTVQAELNQALSTILNIKIELVGAGRTDAGVHAKQMFAHFDCEIKFEISRTLDKLNRFLPNDIAVHKIFKVKSDISCRFNALSRTYEYHIANTKDPFNPYIYILRKKLDVKAMNSACEYLLGKQDFTSFSKVKTQTATNNCNIMKAQWEIREDRLIFSIKADRFLRNMVRAIVGTLLDIGMGKSSVDSLKNIISERDRCKAGASVPAYALFLMEIEYSKEIRG